MLGYSNFLQQPNFISVTEIGYYYVYCVANDKQQAAGKTSS